MTFKPAFTTLVGTTREFRALLAISYVTTPDGKQLVVSSYYSDFWDFTATYPHAARSNMEKFIDWSKCAPGWDELLREILTTFIHIRRPPNGRRLDAHTIPKAFYVLNAVCRWLTGRGIRRLKDATAIDMLEFLRQLKKDGDIDRTVNNKLNHLRRIFDMSSYLSDSFTEAAIKAIAPSTFEDFTDSEPRSQKTQIIPFPQLAKLFRAALDELSSAKHVFYLRSCLTNAEWSGAVPDVPLEDIIVATKQKCVHNDLETALESRLILIRSACYILLAICTGCRVHELGDVRVGCVYEEKIDGEDYYWLKSSSRKISDGPARWLAPKLAKDVAAILTELSSPLRAEVQLQLQDLEAQYYSCGDDEAKQVRLAVAIAEQRMNRERLFLSKSWDGVISSTSTMAHNNALKRFADLAGVELATPLTTHRFRRTYAAVIVRLSKGVGIDLVTLQHHMKHASLLMTEWYTELTDVDVDLLDMIDEEVQLFDTQLFTGWMEPDAPIAGGLGLRIKTYRAGQMPLMFKSHGAFINSIRSGLSIRGTGHSWCLAEEDGCGGQGLFEATRCGDCGNGVLDHHHVPIWTSIAEQQQEILRCKDIGEGGVKKAKDALEKAQAILDKLTATNKKGGKNAS